MKCRPFQLSNFSGGRTKQFPIPSPPCNIPYLTPHFTRCSIRNLNQGHDSPATTIAEVLEEMGMNKVGKPLNVWETMAA